MLKYVETDSENSRITNIISAPDEQTMLTKLRKHYLQMFDEDEDVFKIKSARDLEELGAAVDYTYGWGENDIKVGHLIEELSSGTYRQIW